MKIQYDEKEKKLTITDCEYDAVEIYKADKFLVDIKLENGEGFWINQDEITIGDNIIVYPYNILEVKVDKQVEI